MAFPLSSGFDPWLELIYMNHGYMTAPILTVFSFLGTAQVET
jgi:hypothetical protein